MDLYVFSKPEPRLRLLFIHHSVGGALLASPGREEELAPCIWRFHESGGGGRTCLERAGYEVHEASYGSRIGARTDLFDWLPKLRDQMEAILTCDRDDRLYKDGRRNDVVVFKSCFPNNRFAGEGTAPGSATGPALTVWNAKAALLSLLPELEKYPETLFVYLTTPPLAPRVRRDPAWKSLAKNVLGLPSSTERLIAQSRLARSFADWVVADDGWLKDYPLRNVAAFDLFDVLTDQGASDMLRYPSDDGYDAHPTGRGNRRVVEAFVPFLERAVQRAALAEHAVAVHGREAMRPRPSTG